MSQRDALLAAVCAAPDDDLPRLVFADWCDDHDDPDRAEFIRVQIEIANRAKGKKLAALRERENALLGMYSDAWTVLLKKFTDDFFADPLRFRRGFVEDISINDELLEEHGEELFESAPIRTLRMGDQDGFNDLHKCKHLLRVAALDLTGSSLDSGRGSSTLFRSRYLANLTTLIARGYDDNGHLDADALEAIATSKHLTKLRHLNIGDNWLFDTTLTDHFSREQECLFSLGDLPALAELELHGVGLGHAVVELAARPWLARLTSLGLAANSIDDRGARALAESSHLEHIRRLDLRSNVVQSDDGETGLSEDVKWRLKRRFGKRVLLDD